MVYIRSIGNVSPQATFGAEGRANFGTTGFEPSGTAASATGRDLITPAAPAVYTGNRLKAIEPDYSKYIDAKLIRRMSRIIRMGVAAAMDCLDGAAAEPGAPTGAGVRAEAPQGAAATPTTVGASPGRLVPEAIITGTAYGCLEDTVTFLRRMVENKEEMLTPTAFIQSTHNTVGAQIALMLQCHGYNNTFVHSGFSFESALLDAQMLLEEGQANNVLVGGVDEITDTSHTILERFGLFKRETVSNLELYDTKTKGTINGEGAVFFLLSKEPGGLARLDGMETFYKPTDLEDTTQHIRGFLNRHQVSLAAIDLILLGINGNILEDEAYDLIRSQVFPNTPVAGFKHLCGEYPTASAFALWLATQKIQSGLKRVLIYNQQQQSHHSLYLVSACGT